MPQRELRRMIEHLSRNADMSPRVIREFKKFNSFRQDCLSV